MMEEIAVHGKNAQSWAREKLFMDKTFAQYLKTLLTPFNIVTGLILLGGGYLIVLRYAHGLTVVMHPSNTYPWGLFICFGLLGIVPLSATGYIMASAVYLFGLKEYKSVLRLALLTGFLAVRGSHSLIVSIHAIVVRQNTGLDTGGQAARYTGRGGCHLSCSGA